MSIGDNLGSIHDQLKLKLESFVSLHLFAPNNLIFYDRLLSAFLRFLLTLLGNVLLKLKEILTSIQEPCGMVCKWCDVDW